MFAEGGEPLIKSEFGIGEGPVFLDYLSCNSDNEQLLDCPSLFFLSLCSQQDIGVRCNGKKIVSVLCILGFALI